MNPFAKQIRSTTCLGFAVGAFCFAASRTDAQIIGAPASEVPLPTKVPTDTTKVKKDSVKAPIGVMAGVRLTEIGPEYHWRGNEIFATGAVTLSDLLERVPGINIIRSGGILSPQIPRQMGAVGRVKIYLDGVELDNLDRRAESLDLAWIPLWSLEDVRVDRSAGEIRVNLRTQSVNSTTPFTRTDVYTGDEDTNIYRGFYGKRFDRGHALQLAAEQATTGSARSGSGDKLSVLTRLGTANRRWSLDAFANRTHGARDLQRPLTEGRPVPAYDATTTYAYIRFVAGNATRGPWAAVIVSSLNTGESSPRTDSARAKLTRVAVDTVDSARSERQFVLRTGFTAARFLSTIDDRIRSIDGRTYHDFTGAGQVFLGPLTAGGRIKQSGFSTSRAEAWGRFQPLSFIALNGSVARNTPPSRSSPSYSPAIPTYTFAQIEAGVRLFGPWLAAGVMTQDTLASAAPTIFGQGFSGNSSGQGNATYASLRGTFLRDFSLDAYAVRWDVESFYRPRTQSRTELRFRTNWRSRFPKGEFELNSAVTHNYRSATFFRMGSESLSVDAAQYLDLLVEIRIMRGVATYQLRNMTGYPYENLPGFFAQRAFNLYGIRWEFFN